MLFANTCQENWFGISWRLELVHTITHDSFDDFCKKMLDLNTGACGLPTVANGNEYWDKNFVPRCDHT